MYRAANCGNAAAAASRFPDGLRYYQGVSDIWPVFLRRTKSWILRHEVIKQGPIPPASTRNQSAMKMLVAACFLLGLSVTSASAIDLAELAPCRPAAARLCDRSGGMSFSNLLQCGATLAAHSWRVSGSCRAVLRKYGQL
jgi:hypothetical protein